ncbi:uncharacterized protein LOC114325641 [Diabrotica virgifera virgifera]|uniref:Uncharacterized protein LOC114325641 n=1 Tax=Diabrotica virgifera virgifera TaxID=50390 RepID=A0A6P7F7X2_DIAVI|nr:uncharacterized protein LOC114325641 [Diabrotica virgifera virgifera]
MSSGVVKDQEEGEIVDDDYEEISDNSMSFPLNESGKSQSVICLSSLSEFEEEDHQRRVGKMLKRGRKMKHHGHHRRKKKYFGKLHKSRKWKKLLKHIESSSDDESVDCRLVRKQLKAAIRVESPSVDTKVRTEGNQVNCLKNRLIAMTKLNDDSVIEQQCDIIKSDNENRTDDPIIDSGDTLEQTDIELTQLRLEALRTAVLNKFEDRKKRKHEELQKNQESPNIDNLETNKENSIQENGNIKQPSTDKPNLQPTTPDEEDEDVLRAMLLASMSRKMPKFAESKSLEEPVVEKVKSNQNVVKPFIVQAKKPVPLRQHQIKPIIINIGSDTESEDEKSTTDIINTKTTELPVNGYQVDKEIESTVENFLKEQRAKVDEVQAVTKQVVPPKNPTVEVTTPKSKIQPKRNESAVLEKSSVKLLTKEKQIEYQKLLQRLKMAQKKPKTRRVSVRGTEEGNNSRKNVKTKLINSPKPPIANKSFSVQQDAGNLHLILKQMQKEQNGRLQIEEKYVVLTPIIKKINEATTERRKYDQEVKRLLGALADAKRKLHNSHQTFSMYVKELTKMKEEIDKRPKTPIKRNGIATPPLTSTPNTSQISVAPLDVSKVSVTLNTTCPIPDTTNSTTLIAPTSQPSSPAPSTVLISETMLDRSGSECNMDIEEQHQGEIIVNCVDGKAESADELLSCGDPNDLSFSIVIPETESSSKGIPEYVSPLDHVKRESRIDPFVIICPYDICGKCRDTECTYKHYDK